MTGKCPSFGAQGVRTSGMLPYTYKYQKNNLLMDNGIYRGGAYWDPYRYDIAEKTLYDEIEIYVKKKKEND